MTTSTTWWLNVVGLSVSTVAAIVIYYYPPRVQLFTKKGEPVFTWVANPTPQGVSRGALQSRLSRLSPILLALGFILQLVATILSA